MEIKMVEEILTTKFEILKILSCEEEVKNRQCVG